MKNLLANSSIEKKLGLLALLLGIIALIIGGTPDKHSIKVNAKEMLLTSIRENDKINVETLADWIIKGNADFTIVDLRTDKAYNEYHIPGSYNIPISDLLNGDLMRNQKIILYSDDGVNAAQAWFVLKSDDYKGVYILNGGLKVWKDKILFPKLVSNATPVQITEFEKMKEVSKFFGGTPQSGTEETIAPVVQMPKLTMPAASPTGGGKKKKREGC
jgi:hypothetical protein